MLRCIQRKETDPYFNIAAEEHLLHNAIEDTFMIWQNDPCVIIGKHQNAAREINHTIVQRKNIPVIRRITGGGTVYHDPGNINFSFIRLNRKENPIDFKFFTHPVIIFLQSMGLDAEFEGKSNITVNDLKVSGNSAHVHKGRVLHHGTLLFETDLEMLVNVMNSREELYNDRSVRSIRKKVTNISSHIHAAMLVEDFKELFFSFIINYYPDAYHDQLKEEEYRSISDLVRTKYQNLSWNYGYSPDYQYSDDWSTSSGDFKLSLVIKEGIIDKIAIEGPSEYSIFLKYLEQYLLGVLHERYSINKHLKKAKFASENEGIILNQLIDHLF